mgnify:CR=1 FL=1
MKVKAKDLIHDDKNFNKGSEVGAELIKKSFSKFGAGRSILLDKNNRIIAGNKSVEFSGIDDVQIVESDGSRIIAVKRTDIDLDTPLGREMALADNASAKANIVFDAELIEAELGEAVCVEWGIDVATKLEAEEDDFDVPEEGIETDIVLGDLFEIGDHRLLCGDSTDSDAVAKLMDGQKADMAFTSPPYNAAKNSHLNGRVKGFDEKYQNKNDAKTDEEYIQFLYDFTINSITFATYSFINIQMLAQNKFTLIDYQYKLKEQLKDILIWNKSQCPPNIVKGAFNTKWEYVFCFSEKNETRGFPCKWQGKFPNVIETENASGNDYAQIHKATFPIAFPSWIIEKMDFAKSVLDLFMGTGTTMVAAHQLKRKCYGMELDPKYCQVIIDRMKKLDPTLIIKRNGVTI